MVRRIKIAATFLIVRVSPLSFHAQLYRLFDFIETQPDLFDTLFYELTLVAIPTPERDLKSV